MWIDNEYKEAVMHNAMIFHVYPAMPTPPGILQATPVLAP